MKTLYLAHCTEYESGWGTRPDGIVVADSLDVLSNYINEDEKGGSYEIFWRYDKPYEVFCDDDTYKKICEKMSLAKQNVCWITQNDIKNWGFFKKL